jgi:pilus assembly protein CpaC
MSKLQFHPRAVHNGRVRFFALALGALFVGAALMPAPASAASSHLRLTQASYGATQDMALDLNKSVIVDLPADVKEVIVSQPAVAAAIMRSKRRAIIQGASPGSTNIFFLDASGQTISVIDVNVLDSSTSSADAVALSDTLRSVLPGSHIMVESFGERVVLSGTVVSGDDLTKALAIAAQFTGSPENVANVITMGGSQQVMLKVTIAEVSRETVKQLGIDLNASLQLGNATLGFGSQQPLGGASGVSSNNGITAGIAGSNFSLDAQLRALERRGAIHTLAEPTLTALSGQEAEFLAGGQFPVPSGVADGVVSFEFKEFGVKLKFTPTVRSNGVIGLIVDTSVSEPTTQGGFNQGGITIPATRERQARTSVELQSGSTLSIAGIFQDEVRQQINELPGLGDIPILGALFRSRDFIHAQTELVILVTPYIAEAGPRPTLPTDGITITSDAEATFLGHMEALYGVGTPDGMRGGYDGSVGFVLD